MSVFSTDWVDMFWKKGFRLAPNMLPSEDELSTAWASIYMIRCGNPENVTHVTPFLRVSRCSRRENCLSLPLSFCWLMTLFFFLTLFGGTIK